MIRKFTMPACHAIPADGLEGRLSALQGMPFEGLEAFARENGIDLGRTTSQAGAFEKIAAFLKGQEETDAS